MEVEVVIIFFTGIVLGMYLSSQLKIHIRKNILHNNLNNMNYKNIRKILQKQVDNNVKTFWVYIEDSKEFIQIYKNYSDRLRIYTPQQLLDYLDEIQM
jgi:hypothetical protein